MEENYPVGYITGDLLPEAPPLSWVIKNMYPSDALCLLPAKSNAGKSALVANVVAAVLKNGSNAPKHFLDYDMFKIERPGGKVVLATFEANFRTLRLMLDNLGLSQHERSGLLATIGDSDKPRDTLAHFGEAILKFKPDIAIADSLVYLFDPQVTDINDYISMLRALTPIRKLMRESNGCLLVTAHARKAGGDDLDAVLGSTGIGGAVDKAALITKHGPDVNAPRTLSDIKTRLGFGDETFPRLTLSFDYSTYRMSARPFTPGIGNTKPIIDSHIEARISKRIKDAYPLLLTKDEAIAKIGVRTVDGRRVFEGMVQNGKLFAITPGRYQLLEDMPK